MNSFFLLLTSRIRRRGTPARLGSLLMILQRSPLLKLLPEARVISSSGFSDALGWAVTVVAGLGAFDSVSGATNVSQVSPVQNSPTVPATGGANLNFFYTVVGAGGHTPNSFQVIGALPAGLVQTGRKNSKTDSITGVPTQTGNFPIRIVAWENSGNTGRSTSGNFTIVVANPPAPVITASPQGGNFQPGAFVSLEAVQTSGFTFTWKKDGVALPSAGQTLVSTTAPRRYLVPASDPGTVWRSGNAFTDTAWTAVSGGIGYDTSTATVNYLPHIATGGNVQSLMSGLRTSACVRIPFTLTGSTPLSTLQLRVQSDDGFVIWLNGTEVASLNKPATLAWNSAASGNAADVSAIAWATWNLNAHSSRLRSGENLLAVQVLNESASSSDLLFNCELLSGTDATNTRRLIIPAVQPEQAGSYTVTAANPAGSATSDPAVIVLPPSILTQPQSVTIAGGATATLTVEAATSPPWSWQWYAGESGVTANPVAGATGPSFTTPALSQTEKYWVRVTNAAGSAESATATVTVLALPPVIEAHPLSGEVDAGGTMVLQVTAAGDGPFTYQWFQGASGDTAAPIPLATLSSFTTPPLFQSTSYWVRVGNGGGPANSQTAVITVRTPFAAWQHASFTPAEAADPAISGLAADPDGDGLSNEREYVFGTGPRNAQPAPAPALSSDGQNLLLTFVAGKAAGPGYAGRTRHCAIETTADPVTGPWVPLPGFTDIVGNNQEVTAAIPAASARIYCHLKVWLTP
jgi:hypothetical protein